MDRPENGGLEPYMVEGLKLLRAVNDPKALEKMYERFNEAIKVHYGDRKPRNAAKDMPVPAALFKDGKQASMTVDESSCSSSAKEPISIASSSAAEACSSLPPLITMEQAKSDPVIAIQSDFGDEPYGSEECYICKDSFTIIRNKLLECFECHRMYHQSCHTPPVIGMILDDPRLIWYCCQCRPKASKKNDLSVKKIQKKTKVKAHTSSSQQISISANEMASGSKPSSASASSSTMSTGTKINVSTSTLSPNQPSDISSKIIKIQSPNPNILAVEKRVKLMKKNAAAKKIEKSKKKKN